jgi:hypothetical protein
MFFLQNDIVKFVSEPSSPPRLVEIPDEWKGKAKERREVGEGDTSDEDDEEMLQERFHLRSSLEASLPAPPRKPRNVARKRVAKKLKVMETTSQEVSFLE